MPATAAKHERIPRRPWRCRWIWTQRHACAARFQHYHGQKSIRRGVRRVAGRRAAWQTVLGFMAPMRFCSSRSINVRNSLAQIPVTRSWPWASPSPSTRSRRPTSYRRCPSSWRCEVRAMLTRHSCRDELCSAAADSLQCSRTWTRSRRCSCAACAASGASSLTRPSFGASPAVRRLLSHAGGTFA